MSGLLERLYRRLGPRYPRTLFAAQAQLNYLVVLLAIIVLALYVPMSGGEFLGLVAVSAAMALAYNQVYTRTARRAIEPVTAWLEGERNEEATRSAWRTAVAFPQEMLRRELSPRSLGLAVAAVNLVWCAYATWQLDLPLYATPLLFVGILVYIAYTLMLRFLVIEQILRPVVEDVSAHATEPKAPPSRRMALRWRLLATLPALNVFSGVVAVGLANPGSDVSDLAIAVGVSIAVALTVTLVLTLLVSDAITTPLGELRDAAETVGEGEFERRVPVVTTDEIGELAGAFNQMTAGLAERERIREAFGTYVDREVAEHILEEGTDLAGEQVEVTIMFIDIRDFTGFAERSSAAEVVAILNRLFEQIVPIIHAHDGHVDKFVGDGLLAVFGAPRRQEDHAEQALSAALKIDGTVRREFDGQLEIGIGLNSGIVVAGNVGGAGRLEFSVIGDAVNTAARVEAATRETGDVVLLAENVKRLLGGTEARFEARPDVNLKGKRESVMLYAPSPDPEPGGRENS